VKFAAEKTAKPDDEASVKHVSYELEPLVKAILSVGYDGTLAVEFRGTGDAKLGVMRSRRALERFLDGDPEPVGDEDE